MTEDAPTLAPTGRRGIGGWLLFFCIANTILWPPLMVAIAAMHSDRYWHSASDSAAFVRLVVASDAVGLALAALGFHAGLRLWRVERGAVAEARLFLLVSGAVQALGVAMPYVFALPAEVRDRALLPNVAGAVGTALVVCAWLVYFQRSRRVAATYAGVDQ